MIEDRVRETSFTSGTGYMELEGAARGCQTFANAIGYGQKCYYCIIHRTNDEWEIGIGSSQSGSPEILSRDTPLKGSSGDATLVNFASGTKDIFVVKPADELRRIICLNTRPPNPVVGDLWISTDTSKVIWRWDGTYWKSLHQYSVQATRSLYATGSFYSVLDLLPSFNFDLYIKSFFWSYKADPSNTPAHYNKLSAVLYDKDLVTTVLGTLNSSAATGNKWYTASMDLNTYLDLSALRGETVPDALLLSFDHSSQGSPLQISWAAKLTYYLVNPES